MKIIVWPWVFPSRTAELSNSVLPQRAASSGTFPERSKLFPVKALQLPNLPSLLKKANPSTVYPVSSLQDPKYGKQQHDLTLPKKTNPDVTSSLDSQVQKLINDSTSFSLESQAYA